MFSESIDKLEVDRENEAMNNPGKPSYCEEIPFFYQKIKVQKSDHNLM
jgi:hypothetical protein